MRPWQVFIKLSHHHISKTGSHRDRRHRPVRISALWEAPAPVHPVSTTWLYKMRDATRAINYVYSTHQMWQASGVVRCDSPERLEHEWLWRPSPRILYSCSDATLTRGPHYQIISAAWIKRNNVSCFLNQNPSQVLVVRILTFIVSWFPHFHPGPRVSHRPCV